MIIFFAKSDTLIPPSTTSRRMVTGFPSTLDALSNVRIANKQTSRLKNFRAPNFLSLKVGSLYITSESNDHKNRNPKVLATTSLGSTSIHFIRCRPMTMARDARRPITKCLFDFRSEIMPKNRSTSSISLL